MAPTHCVEAAREFGVGSEGGGVVMLGAGSPEGRARISSDDSKRPSETSRGGTRSLCRAALDDTEALIDPLYYLGHSDEAYLHSWLDSHPAP